MENRPARQAGAAKQERAVRTRATILRAAAEVFDEVGFSAASIRLISNRAGATLGALYFHFSSKEELARAVMLSQADELVLPAGPDGLQRLVDITAYLAEQLQTNPVLRGGVRLAVEQGAFGMREEQPYQQWAEVFRAQLSAAEEAGELNESCDVDALAWLVVSTFSGTQLFSQITTDRQDLPERVHTLWTYLLPGIASDKVRGSLTVGPPGPRAAGREPAA
ncbi:ScbR family autoregulator-binding transcription factor [Streptomyces sp. NPDC051211]|uniref:ScbR family autoregulator-binding transcription factor n=1 Tax=Streptomyces sp. NPDC051211 TaxID=3154643 RepID=UPI0034502F9A